MAANETITSPTGAFPTVERFSKCDLAFAAYQTTRTADPQAAKRAEILRAFYRYPWGDKNDFAECVLKYPARANLGGFAADCNRAIDAFLDLVYERNHDAVVKCKKRLKEYPEGMTHEKINDVLSDGFHDYIVDPWEGYGETYEITVTQLVLHGKTVWWKQPDEVYPRYLLSGRCLPNPGAGFNVNKWEYCFVEESVSALDLWKRAKADDTWDKTVLKKIIIGTAGTLNQIGNEEDWVRREQDGSWLSSLYRTNVDIVWLFAREFGGKVSRYCISLADPTKWLWRKRNAIEKMSDVFTIITDSFGHGSYYFTPSIAEMFYVAEKEYDLLMNRAKNAAGINSMLMTEGTDNQSRTIKTFYDGLHFPHGTRPSQVGFKLPVQETVLLGKDLKSTARADAAIYDPQQKRETAEKIRADLFQSDRASSVRLRRFNAQLTAAYQALYDDALSSGRTEEGDYAKNKKEMIEFFKSEGITEKIYKDATVESKMTMAAGDPAARLARAREGMALARIPVRSPAEQRFKEDAMRALVGSSNAGEYTEDGPTIDNEDRQIGAENEGLSSLGSTPDNFPVLQSDFHEQHVMGKEPGENNPQPVPGHFTIAARHLQQGMQLLEAAPQVPQTDIALLMDRVSEKLGAGQNLIQHSLGHIERLASGPPDEYNTVKAIHAQLVRQSTELASAFQQAQAARAQAQQQQSGGMSPDEQAKLQLTMAKGQIEVETKKALAEIEVAKTVQTATIAAQGAQDLSNAKQNAIIEQAAVKAAAKASEPKP